MGATCVFWTFDLVEERLVEAMQLWKRAPGGGKWPFASDGPWHLVKSELYGPDVDKDAPIKPLPLRRAEMARMQEASEWLLHVPERDRRLVVLALVQLSRGEKRVSWRRLLKPMGLKLGADGLRMRYSRAITGIAKVLNSRKSLVDGVSRSMVKPDENKGCSPSTPKQVLS